MRIIQSRGTVNKAEQEKLPIVDQAVTLRAGSQYVKDIFQHKVPAGQTLEESLSEYTNHVAEVGKDYEPHMDVYVMWCNGLVRDSKHPRGRVYFARDGVKYLFAGGVNQYTVYEVEL